MFMMSFLGKLDNTATIFWLSSLNEAGFQNETEAMVYYL